MERSTGCILDPNIISLFENDKLSFLIIKPAVDVDLATTKSAAPSGTLIGEWKPARV